MERGLGTGCGVAWRGVCAGTGVRGSLFVLLVSGLSARSSFTAWTNQMGMCASGSEGVDAPSHLHRIKAA